MSYYGGILFNIAPTKKEKMKSIPAMLFMTAFSTIVTSFSGNQNVISDKSYDFRKDTIIKKRKFQGQPDYWFPAQKRPSRIIICNVNYKNPGEGMLAQSVSGLAAQGVNEGTFDALIWLNIKGLKNTDYTSFNTWLEMAKNRLEINQVDTMSLWGLVNQLRFKGIIKGYVLYTPDVSVGKAYKYRADMNQSANLATTVAGVLKGVMISENLVSYAAAYGLRKLLDVRKETYASVYQKFKDSLNPNMAMHVDPKFPNHRALAIAFSNHVFYGAQWYEQFMPAINPVSPVLGWGDNNEVLYTTALSKYGLINIASNYSDNLLINAADAHNYQPRKVKTLDPKTIDFSKPGSFYSFIMSDGDNLQWMQRRFFFDKRYWANPSHGDFPMGWTSSLSMLSELLPDALDYMASTQPANSSIIEAEGGYNYVDQFGLLTPDREKTLRDFAKKVNVHMKKTGARILELFCLDINGQAARDAYQIYAEEVENLTGMIVVEFSAGYEGSNGEIFWPTNKEGIHIPVVGSKFSLWDSLPPSYTRSGGPARLANIINADANAAQQSGTQNMDWAIVMAWSQSTQNGVTTQGLSPVAWCVDKLNSNVNVVSPEELLWRIRMKQYPDETCELINKKSK